MKKYDVFKICLGEKTKEWLMRVTRPIEGYRKPMRCFGHYLNIKLLYDTNDVRIMKDGQGRILMQVEDYDVEVMEKSAFVEKVSKPATMYFNEDLTEVHCSCEMYLKLQDLVKSHFGESLTKKRPEAKEEVVEPIYDIELKAALSEAIDEALNEI